GGRCGPADAVDRVTRPGRGPSGHPADTRELLPERGRSAGGGVAGAAGGVALASSRDLGLHLPNQASRPRAIAEAASTIAPRSTSWMVLMRAIIPAGWRSKDSPRAVATRHRTSVIIGRSSRARMVSRSAIFTQNAVLPR